MADIGAGLVQLTNSMLDQLHIPTHLSSLAELNSMIYALIYEGLCGERIPDLIEKPRNHQDEVHNCQLVIDSLSMDVLHTSLSHITGEDLATGDRIAISNLLDIYSGLMEYILNKIDSDFSSVDGDNVVEGDDDPDVMASYIIDDILQRELGRSREPNKQTNGRTKKPPTGAQTYPNSRQKREPSPERLLATRNSSTLRAPAAWESTTGRRLETTDSLIREGELLERQMRSPPVKDIQAMSHRETASNVTPELTPPQRAEGGQVGFDHIGVRDKTQNMRGSRREITQSRPKDITGGQHLTYTHHLYHHYTDPRSHSGLSGLRKDGADVISGTEAAMRAATMPADTLFMEPDRLSSKAHVESDKRLRCTVPGPPTQASDRLQSADVRNRAPTYDSLKATVEKTVQMTRDAVSPERRNVQENLLSDNIRKRLSRIEVESSEINNLAASLNLPQPVRQTVAERPLSQSAGPSSSASQQQSPSRGQRKVCFLVDEKQDRNKAQNGSGLPDSSVKSSLQRFYEVKSRRKQMSDDIGRGQTKASGAESVLLPRTVYGYGSDVDLYDFLSDSLSSPEASPVRKPYSLSSPEPSPVRQPFSLSSPEASPVRQPYSKRYSKLLLRDLTGGAGKKQQTGKNKKTDLNIQRKKGAVNAIKDTQKFVDKEDMKARRKTDYLRLLYEHELEDFRDELNEQRSNEKTKTESDYKKKVSRAKPKVATGRKTGVVTGKVGSRLGRTKVKQRRRSASASPTMGRRIASSTIEPENNLFSMLYQEFPYLYLSPDTWHELWREGIQQIERLTRAQQTAQTRKNRGIAQLEEAEDRQKILLSIMKKELAHSQRMREQKSKRQQELSIKNKLHEKRMQSAKARKYYGEYQVRSRAKMLKRRTKEEMIFKKVFRDGLDIQKERIKELRRYAKEQREIQAKDRQNEIDSMENYYRDKFEMLAESVTQERQDQQMREKAQTRVLEQMKRELRKKMEKEIEEFQEQLFRDDDDLYFRQLDADRLKEELRVAKYHVKV